DHCEQKPLGWSKLKGILISSDYLASALTDNTINVLPKLFRVPDLKYFSSDTRKSPLYPLSMMNTADKRKHTIVIAPTGAGKTDFLMRRCSKRVFYILPFQASINAMYKRFKSSLPPETDIRLLHAASSVVIKNKNEYEEKVLQPLVGSSVKVLTPHQIASLICGTRGFESIAVDIAGCDVILDEIHCYSDLSQSMVIEIIKVLIKLNCTVHVGTATMPGALLKIIHELLGGEENVYLVRLPEKVLDTFNRHKILKHENELSALSVVDKAVSRNEKILIVCNRVEIAQKRFYELKKKYDGIPMLLLHSRFRRIDRSLLEDKLKNEFNDRDKLPGSCIVVSTQVVEVSLDISFDIMITDAAPLDSLIQRFGRINRYRTEETLKKKTIREIHVIAPPENLKDCLPYKKEIVSSSFDQLPDKKILREKDLQNKIDAVFPSVSLNPISTHLVWNGGQFLLKELCHFSKSVLIESLNIESASCIRFSDKEKYEKGNIETKISLEIPVPRSAVFRSFTNFGRSKYGTNPIIVSDDLYSEDLGLQWKEIENIF
ncbi:MAG: CRISPR-associated helicase Cas3', partial [Bacillota bacterium]